MSRCICTALCFVMTALAQTSLVPADDKIRETLRQRIDERKQGVGMVVGVIEPSGRRFVSYGRFDAAEGREPRDIVFEIGSITKVFTSLLLADMAERGEVALSDPVAKYLPPGTAVPERNGKAITLLDLATHSSGLPRMPDNFHPANPANPYADYSTENLYQFLASYHLPRDIGSQYEYSNLGAGLLGVALANRAHMSYGELVAARITKPLGMNSTAITLSPEMKPRLTGGHNDKLEAVPNWDLAALAGAGAVRSTAGDMVTFLAANLGYSDTPLKAAMTRMIAVRRPASGQELEIGLAWHIFKRSGNDLVWHNGGTGGYRSFTGFDPKQKIGVVVLSNTFTASGVDDIGLHLLDSHFPLLPTPSEHKQITLNPQLFDAYAGRYQLTPNMVLTVTRDGDHLWAQATGQPKAEIYPEGEREFFYKVVDAQITFAPPAGGHSPQLTLHQGGVNLAATRIE